MKIDQKTFEQINTYLSGKMQGQKLDKFKAELKKDKKLRQKVEIQRKIIDSINHVREKELKSYLEEQLFKNENLSVSKRKKIILVSICTLVFLVICFLVFISSSRNHKNIHIINDNQDALVDSSMNSGTPKFLKIDSSKAKNIGSSFKIDTQNIANTIKEVVNETNDTLLLVKKTSLLDTLLESDTNAITSSYHDSMSMLIQNDSATNNDNYIEKDSLIDTRFIPIKAVRSELEIQKNDTLKMLESEIKTGYSSHMSVEIWKSVVNFTGYIYKNNKLQLFGINILDNIQLISLEDRLYLKKNKTYYLIIEDSAKRFIPIKNPILLDVLNEQ